MTVQDTFIPTNTPAPRKRRITVRRILMGGNLGDLGRFPRYLAFALLGGAMIWAPIILKRHLFRSNHIRRSFCQAPVRRLR
jgi:hypothetical protein